MFYLVEKFVENEWLVVAYGGIHGTDKLICLSPAPLPIPINGLIEAHGMYMPDVEKVIDINLSIVEASNTLRGLWFREDQRLEFLTQ